jgi:hypothetical protein
MTRALKKISSTKSNHCGHWTIIGSKEDESNYKKYGAEYRTVALEAEPECYKEKFVIRKIYLKQLRNNLNTVC